MPVLNLLFLVTVVFFMVMAKKLRSHLHDHLIPHEGNGFKPLLFTATGVGAVIVILLLVQAAYFVQTKIVFTQTNFLASVLPGVLATLTNQDRTKSGIAALEPDAHLARAAQMKAEDMASKGYFAHVDPEGRQPWYWFNQAGYQYTYAGENLAVNFTDSEDVQEAWMNSPTHHANIVKAQYSRIGIGVAQGMYQGKETTFVVQFFATPKVAAAPVAPKPEATPAPVEEERTQLAVETASSSASQVLGIEVGTTMPEVPAEEPVRKAEYEVVQVAPEVTQEPVVPVLTQGPVAPALSFFAQVAASPTHTVIYILAGLGGLISILLLVAIGVHIKVRYLEVLGGGLLIILVALGLLVFNATAPTDLEIPPDTQPGAATEAL